MAETKLTHIGKFFQEFSHPNPIAKNLMAWRRSLDESGYRRISVNSMASVEKIEKNDSIMIKDGGLCLLPRLPVLF